MISSSIAANRVTLSTEITSIGPAAKRRRIDPSQAGTEEEEVFELSVRGRGNYEILLRIRDSLELSDMVSQDQLEHLREAQKQ